MMKGVLPFILGACLLALIIDPVSARRVDRGRRRMMREWTDGEVTDPQLIDQGMRDLLMAGESDDYCIVWYDFELMNWKGWTRVDNTAQVDTFTHVDDFAGLGGGDHGGLVAIEGTKSMWCGLRPGSDDYLCSWISAPGYGNDWNQMLRTDRFEFDGLLTFSYHGYFDSEPNYDQTFVEYDAGNNNWTEIEMYEGTVNTVAVHELRLDQAATKLRFHFVSDNAWSDQDGLWNTDGAFILDSLTISDIGGVIDYEDFEGCPVGTKDTRPSSKGGGIWYATVEEPYGMHSGLLYNLASKDPCSDNLSTVVVFMVNAPFCLYPPFCDTPFCKGFGGIEPPCQDEMIVSPIIDMTRYSMNCDENQDAEIPTGELPGLGRTVLKFEVYEDLPYQNLVFYEWAIRNIDPSGCPGLWRDRLIYYYNDAPVFVLKTHDISDLVTEDSLQVKLGCVDMCDVWYGVYGNCANHTPAPWFDNVRLYRYWSVGPQWSFRHLDLFQDNFPELEFAMESYVRADAANDLRPNDDPVIDPGDSIVVTCTSPLGGGIDTTPDGRPKVFMHVRCAYIGDPLSPKPDLFGPALEGTYGTYYSDDGGTWTIFQGEVARSGAGNPVPDKYMFDLNDSLLTRGYQIDYFFEAHDVSGETSILPEDTTQGQYFEFTCLPTLASDILFVDDFHGRGTLIGYVENYWKPTFGSVITPDNQPDRYDVNSPSSLVSNGPGSRAKNYQMMTAYYAVIWDSGNLGVGTITEGTCYSDKSNDAQMLVDWMDFSDHDVGLWICGDDIAEDLDGAPPGIALALMTTWCGVDFVAGSYYGLSGGGASGGVVSPEVEAYPSVGNPLWHTTWGDSFYVFGGCPVINSFDVLEKAGNGQYALQYPDFDGQPYYAGIYANGINIGGYDVRTMWFAFSLMYIRDCEVSCLRRNVVTNDVLGWMTIPTNWGTIPYGICEDEVPGAYSLSQNFPNPFNPVTTIKFGLREKGPVTLRIYNVAGQLVKTLVDDVRDAGWYNATWDGTNNRESRVASGIYFYRLESRDFLATRKMALLR